MEFEESADIMNSIDWAFDHIALSLDHQIPAKDDQGLEKYLQKIVLDDKVDAREFFKEILPEYLNGESYRFTQKVILLSAKK